MTEGMGLENAQAGMTPTNVIADLTLSGRGSSVTALVGMEGDLYAGGNFSTWLAV